MRWLFAGVGCCCNAAVWVWLDFPVPGRKLTQDVHALQCSVAMTMTMVNQPGATAPTTCTSVETSEGTYTCFTTNRHEDKHCVAGFDSGGAFTSGEMSDIVSCCCPRQQCGYAQITAGQDCPSGTKILTLEECKQAAGSSETEWVGGARLWDHTSDGYPTGILDGYPTGGIGCYSNSATTYFSVNAAGHANAGHTALCTTPCAFSYPSLSLFRIATRGPVSLPCLQPEFQQHCR